MVDPDNSSMMISCDKCNVWQHGPCMGVWGDDDAPDGELSLIGGGQDINEQNTFVNSVALIFTVH